MKIRDIGMTRARVTVSLWEISRGCDAVTTFLLDRSTRAGYLYPSSASERKKNKTEACAFGVNSTRATRPGARAMASSEDALDDVAELRRQLEAAKLEATRERARAGAYAAEIKSLKLKHLEAHNAVEREEELLTNNLMKKLEQVNSEKREMFMRVEQEEEYITNSLQKRLDRVLREKSELEAQMARHDHEQAKASGELQRRHETLSAERERLIREKVELERQLEAEQEYIVNKLQKQTAGLAREKDALRAEREELRRQVERLLSDKIRLHQEKVQLENTMEAEEESIVNRLQSQMLELYQRNMMLQRRLEGSATPSVVSESDASEDEGGSFGARRATPNGTPHANPRAGVAVLARQHSGGIPHAHAPWERDMYASFGRRRSQGSASASSAGGRGGGGRPTSANGGGGWNVGAGVGAGAGAGSGSGGIGGGSSAMAPMSVGGSSGATTPRSSAANTPSATPREGSERGESTSPARRGSGSGRGSKATRRRE